MPRTRHYLPPMTLGMLRPLFRYSPHRGAYVLRLIGESHGPVLREDQRRAQREFDGPERRGVSARAGGQHAIAGR